MEDVIVVGGGPAGVAGALWMHQLGLRVQLLEAGPAVGGLQLRSPYTNVWIPGMLGKSGQQVAGLLQQHLREAAVPHRVGFEVKSIRFDGAPSPSHLPAPSNTWEVSNGVDQYRARYLVIATGSKPRHAGFVESDCVGIGPGMSMERLDVQNKRVAVLGGGDNAFDQAALALRRGAASVDIYCRRRPTAQPLLQRLIDARHVHVGAFEADQSRMSVNGKRYDVLGIQFGFDASIPAGLQLPLRNGCIDVDQQGAIATLPRLYAAGEVTNYWHPCVTTSFAHGIQVAKAIQLRMLVDEAEAAADLDRPVAPSHTDDEQPYEQAALAEY